MDARITKAEAALAAAIVMHDKAAGQVVFLRGYLAALRETLTPAETPKEPTDGTAPSRTRSTE